MNGWRIKLSRPIEFRAWDTIENIMYSGAFAIAENGNIIDAGWRHSRGNTAGIIIEQWTGLYDKNKVKIFEGDIIRANGWGNSHSWSNWSRNDAEINTRRVAWRDGSYVLFLPNEDRVTQGFRLCEANQGRFEIVGNIHEGTK